MKATLEIFNQMQADDVIVLLAKRENFGDKFLG